MGVFSPQHLAGRILVNDCKAAGSCVDHYGLLNFTVNVSQVTSLIYVNVWVPNVIERRQARSNDHCGLLLPMSLTHSKLYRRNIV